MPKISYADLMHDWDILLANARRHAKELPDLGPILDDLEAHRSRIKELHQRRMALRAQSQAVTQEIEGHRENGKDLARQARYVLRGQLGSRNEQLTAFNIRLRRTYKKRKKKGKEPAGGDAKPSA